ncbi:MAG: AMP-binding protein [Rhodospirillaceae bacterium]|nr:AMP-binding protein [Rhodospirillaceae bacterium]
MLPRAGSYDACRAAFRWPRPERFNIAQAACTRHADGSGRPALIAVDAGGKTDIVTFDALDAWSNRLGHALAHLGVSRGDRVGILLSQSAECALAHMAVYKIAAIALPLFTLFGEEALAHRLSDSGASVLVTDRANWPKVAALAPSLPALRTVLLTDPEGTPPTGTVAFWPTLEAASDRAIAADTGPDDPAVIIYTSGTTGSPKGAVHGHRVLLGHLPGVEMPHRFFPEPGDRFWTPADWAWIGGLLDVLLPSLYYGVPVVAHRMAKFDVDTTVRLIARTGVRNIFFPPTALKLLRQADPSPIPGLRSIGSGGETLGAELLGWGRDTFGLTINEFYGQTECNLIVANNADLFPVRPGAMGRPVPGHEVVVLGEDGKPAPAGEIGQVAVRRPDPVMFLRYWNNPEATAAKFVGDWMVTGDTAQADDDGYLWFVGRDDDVITSAGYRIGPGEIEDCLMRHPAVALAAAVGVPDPVRTEVVKAVVVLRPGVARTDDLKREIQAFVKTRLAAHEYPRIVEFVDELPMTTTGKIIRRALREAGST